MLDTVRKRLSFNGGIWGGVLIAALLICVFALDLFSLIEYRLSDAVFQKPSGRNPEIAVIGIDERSLEEFGRFQEWDRSMFADAISILNSGEEKPAVIALDIFFIEESANPKYDEMLANAAADAGNVVLASAVVTDDVQTRENEHRTERAVVSYKIPYDTLASHTAYGMTNGTIDSDGVIRSAMLKAPFGDETLYSFPVVISGAYMGVEPRELAPANETYITYYGLPGEYTEGISFCDIFAEDFEPELFAGCIVLIGAYAPGMMDAFPTSIDPVTLMNGVEIHANVVQMLLEGNYKSYVPFNTNLLILAAVVAVSLVLSRLSDIRVVFAAVAAVCALYIGLVLWLFGLGYIIKLFYPVFSVIVLFAYRLVYGYVAEALEKSRVKSAFKKYVDPGLVDKLMETGEANSDEVGLKKDIAVLFVDVRGFTPMSEALANEPETLVKILNEYLELTSSCVFSNGGSVDKFIGDATMALFNGFVPLEDYVFKAVKAAWEIVEGAADVNASIKEKYGVEVGFGVGVNCGSAIVGNLGPSFRKDYTAIGDTVNTAARLEANAKRSQVLISRSVYDLVKGRVTAESVGEIPLKGKSIPLEVFSVTGVTE